VIFILAQTITATLMTNKHLCFLLVLTLLPLISISQKKDSLSTYLQEYKLNDNITYRFTKPRTWDMFKYIPNDIASLGKFASQKENLKWDGLALGSTIAIIPFDQRITEEADKLGASFGLWNEDAHYKKVFGLLSIIPQNVPSAVYYIGNGGTTLLLSGMFWGIGKIGKDDYRALNTSNELVEALFSVGVVDQTIKRVTGRESPNMATKENGAWNPFPSINAFQSQTPSYDAMPSGHMAAYIATVTIIATNYPELKWIKPVGYSIAGVLGFNMVSGKVHWASDYPLAIFIGYVMGKTIANRRIIKKENNILGIKKTAFRTNYTFNRYNNVNLVGVSICF
jgi:hypothetical protein